MDEAAGRSKRERRFHQHVVGDLGHQKRRGYNPTYLLGIIRQHGSAVTVLKVLLSSTRHTTYGFERP